MKNYGRFWRAWNRLSHRDSEEEKRLMVQNWTNGRTEHLSEMTQAEYDAACKELEAAREEGRSQARKSSQAILDAKEKALAAAEEQAKKLKEDLRKAREEAKAANINLQNAEKEAREAKKQAENAGKLAKVNSNENMVKFGVLFNQTQDMVNRMADAMGKEPEENRAKMRKAMEALADAIRKAAGAA